MSTEILRQQCGKMLLGTCSLQPDGTTIHRESSNERIQASPRKKSELRQKKTPFHDFVSPQPNLTLDTNTQNVGKVLETAMKNG